MTVAVDASAVGNGLAAHVPDLVAGRDGWQLVAREPWLLAFPPAHQLREQGWKLHLSATVVDAAAVLRAAAEVLTADPCAFKFAATARTVRFVGGRAVDRASAGKFLTAYPDDDDHFRRLAERLDAATRGLAGPVILSDRPYRPDSLVYYRFGGFTHRSVLDNDGIYRRILTGPDGSQVPDRHEARFAPPQWAGSPLPLDRPDGPDHDTGSGSEPNADARTRPAARAVLLGGRYLVRAAIRHSTKGGVFLAEATDEPAEQLVVKQARPHTECDTSGQDSRDLLRNEARMLDRLAPAGLAPERIAVFEQDGQLFLAERRVVGQSLRQWVEARASGRPGLPQSDAVTMARRLVALLDQVHRAGVVLRDLSPSNVVVGPDDRLTVVDLELAAPVGESGRRGGTPGYQAPEQAHATDEHTRAQIGEDLFSLGALLFLLATGSDPVLPDDEAPARPVGVRLTAWLDLVAAHWGGARALAPAVRGLLRDEPDRRWDLAAARRSLRRQPSGSAQPPEPGLRRPSGRDRLLADGLAHLIASMTPTSSERLWPATGVAAQTDPCNVQHGAAGVLGVLVRAARLGDPGLPDPARAVHLAAEWVGRRLTDGTRELPGLYFGRAGTGWALHDAAELLDRPDLAAQAVDLVLRLPVEWPNADVTHGMSGAGLTHLYLAARTGDPRLATRARRYADMVAGRAEETAEGVGWSVPESFDSQLAGLTHLGFAHGVAGIGWFLLAVAQSTGDAVYLDLAHRAGQTLCDTARREDGAAWWPAMPAGAGRFAHWCSGSSGAGTFLLRLFRATGEQRHADLADAAAHAVHQARWRSSPAACHGLAGNGEFLLDAADVLDEPRYRRWAEDLVDLLHARHAVLGGLAVVPDETGRAVSAGYNTGLSGVLAFLLRLRHGGPRLWMADAEGTGPHRGQRDEPASTSAGGYRNELWGRTDADAPPPAVTRVSPQDTR